MQKSTFFFVLVMMCTVFTTQAGTDDRSIAVTRKLAEKLQLNESAFIKVNQLNDQRFKALDEVASAFGNNQEIKQAKVKEIEAKFCQEMETVLNTNQKVVFHNLMQQHNSYLVAE